MRKIILRTREEKADLRQSWARPDEEFFGSGACHVLAAAFLRAHPQAGFTAWGLMPRNHDRGAHMVVARDDLVFDVGGYSRRAVFLAEYFEAMRALIPGWDATFERLDVDPVDPEYCERAGSRRRDQFLADPLPRALAYVARFPAPGRPDSVER